MSRVKSRVLVVAIAGSIVPFSLAAQTVDEADSLWQFVVSSVADAYQIDAEYCSAAAPGAKSSFDAQAARLSAVVQKVGGVVLRSKKEYRAMATKAVPEAEAEARRGRIDAYKQRLASGDAVTLCPQLLAKLQAISDENILGQFLRTLQPLKVSGR